jgi:hypothetical protein
MLDDWSDFLIMEKATTKPVRNSRIVIFSLHNGVSNMSENFLSRDSFVSNSMFMQLICKLQQHSL